MVERRIVVLKLTHEEARNYTPPPGINVIFLEWSPSRSEVVTEWVASDVQPDPLLRKGLSEIRHEIGTTFRNRVLQDNVTYHHRSPPRAMRVEALLDHPFFNDSATASRDLKRAVNAASDVRDIELTKEQMDNIAVGRKGIKLQPKEVRQKTHKVMQQTPEGGIQFLDEYDQEVYVVTVGMVDSG